MRARVYRVDASKASQPQAWCAFSFRTTSGSLMKATAMPCRGRRAEYHHPSRQVSTSAKVSSPVLFGRSMNAVMPTSRSTILGRAPRCRHTNVARPVASITNRALISTRWPLSRCPVISQSPRGPQAIERNAVFNNIVPPVSCTPSASIRSKRRRSRCHPSPRPVKKNSWRKISSLPQAAAVPWAGRCPAATNFSHNPR